MTTVFISYSWDSPEHKSWVLDFATRLRTEGVDVKLDQWHSVPGDQLPQFMETAVRDSNYVLIVCTKRYKERSDNRTGGVGYEGDIMTGEVMNTKNNRKFIPILRDIVWIEAAPSWLVGKYRVDLSGNPFSESEFTDLTSTLHGTRPQAPPVVVRPKSAPSPVNSTTAPHGSATSLVFEPLHIVGVVIDQVSTPRNDGTRGSLLYTVPFRLSRKPEDVWSQLFIHAWDHPSVINLKHRHGKVTIQGDTIVLEGTTVEEVEQFHKPTLKNAVSEANKKFSEIESQRAQAAAAEKLRVEKHRKTVSEAAKNLRCDD